MDSKDCRAEVGKSQKRRSARILQVRQLSMMSNPYGESITSPRVTFRATGLVGSIRVCLRPYASKTYRHGQRPDACDPCHGNSVRPEVTHRCDSCHKWM